MTIKTAKDNQEIKILTYCHKCHKVFTGSQTCCPECKADEVVVFLIGYLINAWIDIENALAELRAVRLKKGAA